MKNQIKTILVSGVVALLITSCAKETPVAATTTVDPAIEGMRVAYTNATTDNDSLNYWYNHYMTDSAHCNIMMHYCDSLYHQQDSIMMGNYNMCHGNTNTNGGMMNGGMMSGSNSNMDCTINGDDCTAMIDALHQRHIHHPTH